MLVFPTKEEVYLPLRGEQAPALTSRWVPAVRELGMAGFNRVWESPATLPTRDEIRAPMDWVRRISATPALTV